VEFPKHNTLLTNVFVLIVVGSVIVNDLVIVKEEASAIVQV
jgi:hypothetical protein